MPGIAAKLTGDIAALGAVSAASARLQSNAKPAQ
jgi:hypothetical protein